MEAKLESVMQLFAQMEAEGIDTTQPMTYGYFFSDPSNSTLDAAAAWLADRDYSVVSIYENDAGSMTMQLAKTEVHTPETLHKRNEAMNRLAAEFGIELYDGWDVDVG